MRKLPKHHLTLLVGVPAYALILYEMLNRADFANLAALTRNADWGVLSLALALAAALILINGWFLKEVLALHGARLTLPEAVGIWLTTVTTGIITFGLSGTAIVFYKARQKGLRVGRAAIATITYYLFFSVACLIFAFVASGIIAVESVRLLPVLAKLSAILAILILVIFILAGQKRIREFFLDQAKKHLPSSDDESSDMNLLPVTRSAVKITAIAMSALIASAGILQLVLSAFHISVSPAITLENFVVSEIIALFSPSGGGFGFVELGLTGLFTASGLAANQAALVVFTYRLFTLWVEVLAGYGVLLAYGFRFVREYRNGLSRNE